MSDSIKFENSTTERMQIEAEEYISSISRLYSGYDKTYKKFVQEIEQAIQRLDDGKLDINDLEYLAAICVALRRETVLKHKRFV